MRTRTITLTCDGITIEEVHALAAEGAQLEIAPEVRALVARGREVVERAVRGETLHYGLNTGLGHLRDKRVPYEELLRYQLRIVLEHVGAVGPALPDGDVRAIIAARIAGAARGGSGMHPEVFEGLVAMLNARVHPEVPEIGSVGASDLTQMAAIAAVLIGHGTARHGGVTLPGAEALARAGLRPCTLRPKDGLALINANGVSIGQGALAVREAELVAALADAAGALTLEAVGGNPGPFEAEAAAAKPFGGQIESAARVRALLAGSYLYDAGTVLAVQDPLSIRTIPQVHGALREAIAAARTSVTVELNAIDDNPLVSIEHDRLLSTGNFHPLVMAIHFDALRIALAHVGLIAERRLNKIAPQSFGSEPLPSERRDGTFAQPPVTGLLAYTAAALVARLRAFAAPATLDAPPLDLDVEDHATLAPAAVSRARASIGDLETLLVIEILLATERLRRAVRTPRLAPRTGYMYEAVRAAIDTLPPGAAPARAVEAARAALRALPNR